MKYLKIKLNKYPQAGCKIKILYTFALLQSTLYLNFLYNYFDTIILIQLLLSNKIIFKLYLSKFLDISAKFLKRKFFPYQSHK